jgi:hypothetical protein
MNISLLKIAFSKPKSRAGYTFPMPKRPLLAEIGHRLGRKSLEDIAVSAKSDTILGWYRKLIANKFD